MLRIRPRPGGGHSSSCMTTTSSQRPNFRPTSRSVTLVTGTPTLFLDGAPLPLEGLTPESLQTMIEAKG